MLLLQMKVPSSLPLAPTTTHQHHPIIVLAENWIFSAFFCAFWQPKHFADGTGTWMEPNWRCWRWINRWCSVVRQNNPCRMNLCPPPDYLCWILGIIKVCSCLICSQNNMLQALHLNHNQIGDAGAASIGSALAYVILLPCE
jgi:hypothetical protein